MLRSTRCAPWRESEVEYGPEKSGHLDGAVIPASPQVHNEGTRG
jgi:hypothetical protein